MSAVLKPRLSRWGRSVYELDSKIEEERVLLSTLVEVIEDYADAEVIVTHSTQPIGTAEIDQIPSARLVITTTSGFEHLDTERLLKRGIVPVRMPMIRRDAVVESILSMLLHANRRQWQFQKDAALGNWTRGALPDYNPSRLQDQRIAVVGLGVIGQRLCEVLHEFGAKLYGTDPNGIPQNLRYVSSLAWQDMPQNVDVTILTCTLNSDTEQMVNQEWLNRCKNMTLINCARGKMVQVESALLALQNGHLNFLGLDVFPIEPYPQLQVSNRFPNLLFTPHAAGYHPFLAQDIREGLYSILENWMLKRPIPFSLEGI